MRNQFSSSGAVGTRFWLIPAFAVVAIVLLYIRVALSVEINPNAPFYHALTDSFLSGRLYLFEAPSELLKLIDPYDPETNAAFRGSGLHDLSLYEKKFYLYFGPTPVLTLFLPWRLLTGEHLAPAIAAVTYAIGTYVFSLALIYRHLSVTTDRWLAYIRIASIALLPGLCNFALFSLQRSATYEIAILGGGFFSICGLFFLDGLIRKAQGGKLETVIAGICFALAFGSRPNLLPAILICIALAVMAKQSSDRKESNYWIYLLPGTFAAGFLLSLTYNVLRFNDPFEFGLNYTLSLWNMGKTDLFATRFFFPHFSAYLAKPFEFTGTFPWLKTSAALIFYDPGSIPGLGSGRQLSPFVAFPINFLVLIGIGNSILVLKTVESRHELRFFLQMNFAIISCVTFSFVTMATVSFLFLTTLRYQGDFATPLIVAASLIWFRSEPVIENKFGLGATLIFIILIVASLIGGFVISFYERP